jgi:hypothetical protein
VANSVPSTRDPARDLVLLLVGLVTVVALLWISLFLGGLGWFAQLAGGAGLLVLARRVPLDLRDRVLAWLVAASGVANVVLGVIVGAGLLIE